MMLVFAYGSLIDPQSLARALGRELVAEERVPARLRGYGRVYAAPEWVVVDSLPAGAVRALFLDLVRDEAASVNGTLVRVTDEELARLEIRERGYDRVDVTDAIERRLRDDVDERVVTFMGKQGGVPGDVVLEDYVRLVEQGCASLGDEFLAEFRSTTRPPAAPLVGGRYYFADAAQNALTTRGAP